MIKNFRLRGHPELMITSVILAFFIWLGVTNISDPIDYRTISGIGVTFTNVSYIEGNGQAYEVADGFETVSVRVYASRSVREKLSHANITAVADLTQVIDFNSDPVMVPVQVSVPGVSADNVVVTPRNIQIKLEDMKSKDFVINPTAGDTTPNIGYEVGALIAEPEQITIRGSESMVSRIDRVSAKVDVSGLKKDANLQAELKIFDKNGDELTETQKSYLTFSVNEADIIVNVNLYEVDSDVSIEALAFGTPAEGYQVGEIVLTPSQIQVVGDPEALSRFRAAGNVVRIDRESQAIDVSGVTSDISAKVDINNYLPNGIRLASNISSTVVAEVKILPYGSKAYSIDTKHIQKNDLGNDLSAVFSEAELDIRVRGSDQKLTSLTSDQIHASVDLGGKKEGTYTVPVTITLPAGYSLVDEVQTEVVITKTVTETN